MAIKVLLLSLIPLALSAATITQTVSCSLGSDTVISNPCFLDETGNSLGIAQASASGSYTTDGNVLTITSAASVFTAGGTAINEALANETIAMNLTSPYTGAGTVVISGNFSITSGPGSDGGWGQYELNNGQGDVILGGNLAPSAFPNPRTVALAFEPTMTFQMQFSISGDTTESMAEASETCDLQFAFYAANGTPVDVTDPASVVGTGSTPDPATIGLMGVGLILLAVARRNSRDSIEANEPSGR